MSRTLAKRLWSSLIPGLLVAVFLLGNGRPASADAACFQNLRDCYLRAAGRATWVTRSLAGADCELTFVDCVRRFLIGR